VVRPATRRQFIVGVGIATGGIVAGGVLIEVLENGSHDEGLPGLRITKSVIPGGIVAGESVTFGASLSNEGDKITPAGIEIGVVFRVDGKEVAWAGNGGASLRPGASTTLYANAGGADGHGSWTATRGSHVLKATLTDAHHFPEASAANHSESTRFVVSARSASAAAPSTNEAVPLGASATFVSSPQPTAHLSTLTATATSDEEFTLSILESSDGVKIARRSVARAEKAGASYTATVRVKPTETFAAIQVVNGVIAMAALSVSNERT
jgi:hypothetical protein